MLLNIKNNFRAELIICPRGFAFVEYISTVYRSSKTVLEVSREWSQPIKVLWGVMQGDPLSTLLSAMIVDRVLKRLPSEVAYTIREIKINGLAYGDDIVLYVSTTEGMRKLLNVAERDAAKSGLGSTRVSV